MTLPSGRQLRPLQSTEKFGRQIAQDRPAARRRAKYGIVRLVKCQNSGVKDMTGSCQCFAVSTRISICSDSLTGLLAAFYV